MLERWQDATARLWRYSVTHRSLTLLLEKTGTPGNLTIYLGDTKFINAPTQWEHAVLEFTQAGLDRFGDPLILISDIHAGVSITAGVVEVKENVKL
jgi:hypothetical protein